MCVDLAEDNHDLWSDLGACCLSHTRLVLWRPDARILLGDGMLSIVVLVINIARQCRKMILSAVVFLLLLVGFR